MSILSSLFHGEIKDKPNDVHNVKNEKNDGKSLGSYASNLAKSQASSNTKPDMYYTEDEVKRTKNGGVEQSDHTVASKLEQREEMPRG